mmetsp:Transcript_60335/g.170034  ORF Transcript_60335/g.170034 Transcript_60335/m.170034 type:complete len:220 (-) Transcript_60335:134-793(-)
MLSRRDSRGAGSETSGRRGIKTHMRWIHEGLEDLNALRITDEEAVPQAPRLLQEHECKGAVWPEAQVACQDALVNAADALGAHCLGQAVQRTGVESPRPVGAHLLVHQARRRKVEGLHRRRDRDARQHAGREVHGHRVARPGPAHDVLLGDVIGRQLHRAGGGDPGHEGGQAPVVAAQALPAPYVQKGAPERGVAVLVPHVLAAYGLEARLEQEEGAGH